MPGKMKNIFVYGSLMFADVWNRVVCHQYKKHNAVLRGFKRLPVKGENYPGLVKSFDGSVAGVVYFAVTAQDIKRLDKFEGRYYKKSPVTVVCDRGYEYKAETCMFNRRYRRRLSGLPWDPLRFRAQHLSRFISKYNGFR